LGASDRDDVQPLVELMVPAAFEAVLVRWPDKHGLAPFRPELEGALQRGSLNRPRVPLMRPFDAREREPRLEQLMLMRAHHHQPIVLDAPAALRRLLRRRLQIVRADRCEDPAILRTRSFSRRRRVRARSGPLRAAV
jgi:hypothetical protein